MRPFFSSLLSVACVRPALSLHVSSARAWRPAMLIQQRAQLAMKANDQGVEYDVVKSEEEWKKELAPETYYILREKGTERPGTGEYNKFYPKEGHFTCAGCNTPLYSAAAKFDSGCGWPAFDKIVEGAVVTKVSTPYVVHTSCATLIGLSLCARLQTDSSLGMTRVEIMCGGCGGHLGHVFEGEGFTPTMECAPFLDT